MNIISDKTAMHVSESAVWLSNNLEMLMHGLVDDCKCCQQGKWS